MKAGSIQKFELNDFLLQYDCSSEVLLCKARTDGRNLWIKKIDDGGNILEVIDSGELIMIAFEYGETGGQFLAIDKTDGKTRWFIPGKAFMYRIFGQYVFLIFIDSGNRYYLIKSSRLSGGIIWHHQVGIDLEGYSIKSDYITLLYCDGRKEILNTDTGEEIL